MLTDHQLPMVPLQDDPCEEEPRKSRIPSGVLDFSREVQEVIADCSRKMLLIDGAIKVCGKLLDELQPRSEGRIRINWKEKNGLKRPVFRVLRKNQEGKWLAGDLEHSLVIKSLKRKGIFKETYHLTLEVTGIAVKLCRTRDSLAAKLGQVKQGVALSTGFAAKKFDPLELRIIELKSGYSKDVGYIRLQEFLRVMG